MFLCVSMCSLSVFLCAAHCAFNTSSSAIAESPRCKGGLVMAKSGRLEMGDSILQTSVFNHCDVIGWQSNRIR